MKTVIEMANAAGFLSFNVTGWSEEFALLESMIREDERKRQRAAMQIALKALIEASGHLSNEAFVKVMMARDALTKALAQPQDHFRDATKMVEPPKLRRAGSFGD